MNIKEHRNVLELLPLGFAFYDGDGNLGFASKKSKKISKFLFPKKFSSLNVSPKHIKQLTLGRTVLDDDSLYFHLNIKPLKKMKDGCVILAQDTSSRKSYVYLATHDSMTSLYNRSFFETEFERLSNGRSFPVSIIFVDINKLKKINDAHGHSTGDSVITKIGEIIKDSVRKYDIAARFGGDEFVILVPNADSDMTRRIINRIEKKINTHNKQSKLPISISTGCGVAKNKKEMRLKLKEADQKMYNQKAIYVKY